MKHFMPELGEKERLMIMQQNAAKIEQTTYQKPLTPDEMDAKRELLTDNAIKLSELEDEKKVVMDDFKSRMQPLTVANKQLLVDIKTRQETVEGTLFMMADYENNLMETYNEKGEFIASRRLRPDEKQGNVFNLRKTGTDD